MKNQSNDLSLIRSAAVGGWFFSDVQYCIYADIMGVSEKSKNNPDVICGWSLTTVKEFLQIATGDR